MAMMKGVLLLCLIGLSAAAAVPDASKYKPWTGYDGYKVLMITPNTKQQLTIVHDLEAKDELFFFAEASTIYQTVEVLVPPSLTEEIESILTAADVPSTHIWKTTKTTWIQNGLARPSDTRIGQHMPLIWMTSIH